jgi:hypothetical protein
VECNLRKHPAGDLVCIGRARPRLALSNIDVDQVRGREIRPWHQRRSSFRVGRDELEYHRLVSLRQ